MGSLLSRKATEKERRRALQQPRSSNHRVGGLSSSNRSGGEPVRMSSVQQQPFQSVFAKQLLEWLEAEQREGDPTNPHPKTLIVDVRGDDRSAGWIPGSLNIPAQTLTADSLSELAKSPLTRGVRRLVFHCQYSQVRGPKAAQLCATTFASMKTADPPGKGGGEELPPLPEIYLLEGGFMDWRRQCYMSQRLDLVQKEPF